MARISGGNPGGTSGAVTGTGGVGEMAYFSQTSTISSDSTMSFDSLNKILSITTLKPTNINTPSGQLITVTGTNQSDSSAVYWKFDAVNNGDDNGRGFFNIQASSNVAVNGDGNILMFGIRDTNQGSPYMHIYNEDGAGNRVGFLIAGVRQNGNAFIQSQNPMRIEGNGGGLQELDIYSLNSDGGLFISDGSGFVTIVGLNTGYEELVGLMTKYNNKNTAGYGISPIYAVADLTGQTAANASITTFTPASNGTFRVGGYIIITAVTLDVIKLQVSFTDQNNVARTLDFFPQGLTSAQISATGFYAMPTMDIRAKASTAITIKTVLTTGTGSITYDVGGSICQIT